MKRVITIDGPCGAGKSTIAKLVAEKINFKYLDTGAFYRAIALYLHRKGINISASDDKIKRIIKGLNIEFKDSKIFINKKDVSSLIRTPEIGYYSSIFSTKKIVRDFLITPQRKFAERYNTVAEGRDMGTIIFPNAWKKFYLDASIEERAKRRYFQLIKINKNFTMEHAIKDIKERDFRDMHRSIAPLKIPKDAIYIDTTKLTIEETVKEIIKWAFGMT